MLQLKNANLGVRIVPEAGGGLAGFDWLARSEPIALMRRCELPLDTPESTIDPNRLACYPLLPWSNRIANGGFHVGEHWIALSPNREDEALPIHGSGWQRAWQVQAHDTHELRLSLHEDHAESYSYAGTLHYVLLNDALQVHLAVTNTGLMTLPFGLGLHPFFPRHGEVRLHAPAAQVWSNDGCSPLPVERIALPPTWDFREERPLPDAGLDHAFHAWIGTGTIRWPRLRLGLQIHAEADAFVLYTPAGGDFFCFEPVDHPINAVHLPGGAAAHGMTMLPPHATLQRRFVFRVIDPPHKRGD